VRIDARSEGKATTADLNSNLLLRNFLVKKRSGVHDRRFFCLLLLLLLLCRLLMLHARAIDFLQGQVAHLLLNFGRCSRRIVSIFRRLGLGVKFDPASAICVGGDAK
jgi:hypothetical protein